MKARIITTLIIGACAATSINAQSVLNTKNNNHIELLFFQHANNGSIKPASSGCYDLVFSDVDKDVIYFANSPSKKVGTLTLQQYVKTMTHSQLVDKIKPNAVLNFKLGAETRSENMIGSLSNANFEKNKFHYTFCPFNNSVVKNGEIRSIHLFVDPIHRWPP